ncbi:hypothetical protein Q0F98_03070 [Paenibacillus amylolyticus]|nr:hypothetical protein Q0F98_03070 [Paenibacillus amylolyticus]
MSVACSKIADSIEEQGRWSDPELENIIEKHKRTEGEARLQLLKLLRFFRELLRTRKADAKMLERMSDALRTAFVSHPPFAVRGTAIYHVQMTVVILSNYVVMLENRGESMTCPLTTTNNRMIPSASW